MPSIADLVAKNQARIAANEPLVTESPYAPQPPEQTPPAPIIAPSYPVRGTFLPTQMQPADYTNTIRVFQAGSPRSGAFPNPPIAIPVTPLTPTNIVNPVPVTQQPVSTNSPLALDSIVQQGGVDSAIGVVSQRGSMVPSLSAPFEYSSTSSQILIINVGQVILRADGSLLRITDSTVTVTGLTASTTYYAYPYWSEYEQALNYVSSSGSIQNLVGVTLNGSSGDITTTTAVTESAGLTFSLECWFRTTASAAGVLIELNKNHTGAPDTTNTSLAITMEASGVIRAMTAHGLSSLNSPLSYNDGAYHHVVFTGTNNTGSTVSLYVDGALVATTTQNGVGVIGYFYRMGNGGCDGASHFFNGTLADCAVYPTILTAAQVAFHYNTMIQSGPKGYDNVVIDDGATYFWELNETSGTTATDSADSNTGTYTGGFTLNQSQAILMPVGSPAILWTVPAIAVSQVQNYQGNTPLSNGALVVATTASGSGGGIISGSQTASCFSGNTLIITLGGEKKIKDLKVGDKVLTAALTWRSVKELHHHEYSGKVHDMGKAEFITPNHRVLHKGAWVKAQNIYSDWLEVQGIVFNISVGHDADDDKNSVESEQSYTLANGLVVSNQKGWK